jgi:eukaryotic-like serine/threonine-protein kinase
MPKSPVQPGEVIAERYLVERVLGAGGMGVVVSALHRTLGERVAIKLLFEHAAAEPKVIERFLREARAAARLRSEHVVRVSDVATLTNGTPYLVMEFLDGNDVASELSRRGPLPIAEAVDYVLQACEALAEAHAAGIVHRDLKPANLFLASRPGGSRIVKIIDFGIAKSEESASSLTATSGTIGSPMYMSPEQIRSPKAVDQRGDVWSLGVTCYELLTGRLPFNAESVHGTLASIVVDPPLSLRSFRSDLPPELEAALLPCFEKDRNRRYASVAELAKALAPFGDAKAEERVKHIEKVLGSAPSRIKPEPELGGDPTLDAPLTVPEHATVEAWTRTSSAPRHRFRGFAIGGGALIGVVAGLWVLSGEPSQREPHPAAELAPETSRAAVTPPTAAPVAPAAAPLASLAPSAAASTALAPRPRAPAPVTRTARAHARPRVTLPEGSAKPESLPAVTAETEPPLTIKERKF